MPQVIRRARGCAPFPVPLPFNSREILACGAELKNTFCLTKDKYAFTSQHIGDMENQETLEHFETTIELYKRLFRIDPEIIAYDMHPEYLSTKYALGLGEQSKGLKMVPVQHHHAHIASCLAENGVEGPAIGVAFDGTGYGPDGCIWGGEFMVADWRGFERRGHFEYVPMPGVTAAIDRPYRMALSYLHTILGDNTWLDGLPILSSIEPVELGIIKRQLERKINSPLTSSCGRLFDAISALAGIRGKVDYEAQAAIELEMAAPDDAGLTEGSYPFFIDECRGMKVVRLKELFSTVVSDVRNGIPAAQISARFHNTVARMVVQMCQAIARETGITMVALSGGVFQNRLLFRLTKATLEGEGFTVLTHRLVPCNDGGLSLGQAVIAQFAVDGS